MTSLQASAQDIKANGLQVPDYLLGRAGDELFLLSTVATASRQWNGRASELPLDRFGLPDKYRGTLCKVSSNGPAAVISR